MLSSKAQVMKGLQSKIGVNDYGLPDGFYRADILPDYQQLLAEQNPTGNSLNRGGPSNPLAELLQPANVVSIQHRKGGNASAPNNATELQVSPRWLQAAFVPLDYSLGYPTLPNGQPFWAKLDWEADYSFQVFQQYMHMGVGGTRELTKLEMVTAEQAQELYYLFMWGQRSRAFDLYRHVKAQRVREERALALEDDHYFLGQRLAQKAQDYMNTDEFEALMTPKVAVDLLKLGTNLQRLAVGLPVNGPAEGVKDRAPKGAAMEIVLRNFADKAGDAQANRPKTIDQTGQDLTDRLLDDPAAAALAQELIIRMTSGG